MSIVVGVARVEVGLPGARGLKDKRRAITSLIERAQQRFRVSAAEVDHHEQWRRATLAFACISTSARHAHAVLARVADFVDHQGEVVLMDVQIEMR
ncbi:MAG: DUF503 domain-containing protein [Armatimonadota bacterium]|nr:DUF503 domain-containing protein [Armatimonadota bacterium]